MRLVKTPSIGTNSTIMKYLYIFLLFTSCCFFVQSNSQAQTPFIVVKESDATITTHEISSGDVVLGITNLGGGMINKFELPGYGDLLGFESDRYGRGGQTSFRTKVHSRVYNPTQAGLNDRAGTQCNITQTPGKLVVDRRPCALFNGDGRYDFNEWENLVSDGYNGDGGTSGHNSDADGIDETNLAGKQADELTSEFDYYGYYEDYMGQDSVDIPTFHHYYEFTFERYPGGCLDQFGAGTPAYDPTSHVPNITVNAPQGVYKGTDKDMDHFIHWTTLRLDNDLYPVGYRHLVGLDGQLVTELRGSEALNYDIHLSDKADFFPVMVISQSADINEGSAIGVFQPNSDIVAQQTVGGSGSNSYTDDRRFQAYLTDQPYRIPNMQRFGFGGRTFGLLNRNRTPNNEPETWRGEMYFLVGTPAEIYANVLKINAPYTTNSVASAPPSPTFTNSVISCNASVDLSWTANSSADNITMYEVWRSTSSGGTFEYLGASLGTTFTDSTSLDFDMEYFYKIRALNLGGISEFSTVSSIATAGEPIDCSGGTTLTELEEHSFDLRIYPNPIVASELLNQELPDQMLSGYVKASVVDLLGNVLVERVLDNENAVISTGELKQGVHLLKLESEGTSKTLKFIVN